MEWTLITKNVKKRKKKNQQFNVNEHGGWNQFAIEKLTECVPYTISVCINSLCYMKKERERDYNETPFHFHDKIRKTIFTSITKRKKNTIFFFASKLNN